MKNPVHCEVEIVTVSMWQAKPNQKYQITPRHVYHIATGNCTPERTSNVTELDTYTEIDSTGTKEFKATVVSTHEVSYDTIKYSFGEEDCDRICYDQDLGFIYHMAKTISP